MSNEELMKQRHIEQLKVLEEKSFQSSVQMERPGEIQEFNYYQKIQHPLVDGMLDGEDVVIEHEAEHAQIREETRHERKKREQREHKMEEARAKTIDVKRMEVAIGDQRAAQIESQGETTKESVATEKTLLKEKLEAIKLNEDAALETAKAEGRLTAAVEGEIRWRAQADRAVAAGDFAHTLKPDTKERAAAMDRKEKEELKADNLRRLYEVTQIVNPVEQAREEKTIERHAKYDAIKSLTKAFSKDNPLTHEDAVWEQEGHKLVNMGRAFFGGTKPMYIFEDRNAPIMENERIVGYKRYLFKTAVNCLGFKKPEGALVTEAAAALQRTICGENSIPAFAAVQGEEVLGSFQEKIEQKQGERIDLFKWQANPVADLPAQTKDELLREHLLDWLLCNFDTKGENFLQDTHDHIISFDKEASFSFLTKQGSGHMDTDYVPHSNNTIYNVMFKQFEQGNIDLNLQKTEEYLGRVEDMSREDYMRTFSTMLTQKYGESGEKNTERKRIEDLIYSRKDNMREEYRRFYGDLLKKRLDALAAKNLPYDHANEVSDDGSLFEFAGDKQRVKTICQREQLRTGVVPNVTKEQLQHHGGASFHQVRSKEEAETLVADSRGFMYMKEAEHGMYEVRPTMPETVVIDGKNIKMRRNYNRYVKLLVRGELNKEGQPKEGAGGILGELQYRISSEVGGMSRQGAQAHVDKTIDELFSSQYEDKTIFGENLEEGIAEFKTFVKSMIEMDKADCIGSMLVNAECANVWGGMFAALEKTKEPLEQRLEKVQTAMKNSGSSEIEIEKKLETVRSMYADAEKARRELAELRDMDVETPDIALINACSANADTLSKIVGIVTNTVSERFEFATWTHVSDNPDEIFNWLKEQQVKNDGHFLTEENRISMEKIITKYREDVELESAKEEQERQKVVLSETDSKSLLRYANVGAKYDYHKAPAVFHSQGKTVTYETFAPETSQLAVSAFTRHIAVGIYEGNEDAMVEYYKHDIPLAEQATLEKCETNKQIKDRRLPGDK